MKFLSLSLLVLSFGSYVCASEKLSEKPSDKPAVVNLEEAQSLLTTVKDALWTEASTGQKVAEVAAGVVTVGAAAYYFSPTVRGYAKNGSTAVANTVSAVKSDSKKAAAVATTAVVLAGAGLAYKKGLVSGFGSKQEEQKS